MHTYSGHTNERNFVGLSHTGNYIATGSETGEVGVREGGCQKRRLSRREGVKKRGGRERERRKAHSSSNYVCDLEHMSICIQMCGAGYLSIC